MLTPASELSARAAAALAISAVITRGESLRASLLTFDRRLADPRDRGLLRELCFGVMRYLPSLRNEVQKRFQRPLKAADSPLEALLLIGLYQLKTATQPAYAVVHATTECTRELGFSQATGFINAVLRRLQREGFAGFDPSGIADHPPWLKELIERDRPAEAAAIFEANQQHAPMWLRVNTHAISTDEYAAALAQVPGRDARAPAALCLKTPCSVDALPGFVTGQVSVQDFSAQLCAPLLGAEPGMRVLDACAAPGGKAAHLLELNGNQLDLVALDSDAARLRQVSDTLARLHLNATLIAADARDPRAWFSGPAFDRILLDAPCSGLGVIRRHPDIKALRRAADIAAHAQLQRELLDALWPLLKPGGRLLYATCSILKVENEQQIEAFLARQSNAQLEALPAFGAGLEVGLDTGFGSSRFPGEDGGDGFFYALLGKRG